MTDCIIQLAQLNPVMGDITHNTAQVIAQIETARNSIKRIDCIIFPELFLLAYPPEDLLLHPSMPAVLDTALTAIKTHSQGIAVLVGTVVYHDEQCYNAAVFIQNGEITHTYYKQYLPNYGVFDEKRYFTPGQESCVIPLGTARLGILICEDLWEKEAAQKAVAEGANVLISINASPFEKDKVKKRLAIAKERVAETGLPLIYSASVGGQDDLVFDGHSFALNKNSQICVQLPGFCEATALVHWKGDDCFADSKNAVVSEGIAAIYKAIRLGLEDYLKKNQFSRVVLGLSGGIDSAVVLCLVAKILPASQITAILLPSRYTAEHSIEDAALLATRLKVRQHTLSIENVFESSLATLAPLFLDLPTDLTEENLQARIRGLLLMAVANKQNALLLSTSNKSESAMGYTTLYGDMTGGFAPIKDLYKTEVYALARYMNATYEDIIPTRIITRPPSAELAPNQTDQDTLPPYDMLDKILEAYLEKGTAFNEIIQSGFEPSIVKRILRAVDRHEYKRRQAPPGPRISTKAFSRDRRYPMTNKFDATSLNIENA